jgi:hypothetical protein
MEEEERTILAAQRLGVVSMTAGLGGRRRHRSHLFINVAAAADVEDQQSSSHWTKRQRDVD